MKMKTCTLFYSYTPGRSEEGQTLGGALKDNTILTLHPPHHLPSVSNFRIQDSTPVIFGHYIKLSQHTQTLKITPNLGQYCDLLPDFPMIFFKTGIAFGKQVTKYKLKSGDKLLGFGHIFCVKYRKINGVGFGVVKKTLSISRKPKNTKFRGDNLISQTFY